MLLPDGRIAVPLKSETFFAMVREAELSHRPEIVGCVDDGRPKTVVSETALRRLSDRYGPRIQFHCTTTLRLL